MKTLTNKRVLVTGAAAGIGRACGSQRHPQLSQVTPLVKGITPFKLFYRVATCSVSTRAC